MSVTNMILRSSPVCGIGCIHKERFPLVRPATVQYLSSRFQEYYSRLFVTAVPYSMY